MAYSLSADVEHAAGGSDRFIAAADWDGDGVADTAVIDPAIAEADATINSYANKQFLVPFDPVPERVKRWSARLAIIFIRRDRGMLTDDDHKSLLALTTGTKDIKGELKQLADGEILPGSEPIPTKGSIVRDAATPRSDGKAVSRDKLRGFW